ncbi:MAG: PmbA protein [Candidatus Woesearchaeota archaeon]|nr:PmbA protein [Candidatus Woesearchaeota archaeon]
MIEKYIKKFKGFNLIINHSQETDEEVHLKNNSIDHLNSLDKEEFLITAYSKKGIGYLRSNFINESIIRKAIKLSKINADLKYFHGLPPNERTQNQKFYDSRLLDLTIEDLHKISLQILKNRKENISEGLLSKEVVKRRVVNSEGLDKEDTKAYFSYSLDYVNKTTNFSDYGSYSYYPNLLSEIKKNENSLKFYSQRKIKANSKYVVFNLKTLNELMSHAFLDNFSYENIEKNQSLFNFKTKYRFKTKFDLINDGSLKKGYLSSNFDFEGVRKTRSYLVKNGQVNSFFFNYNAAKHYGFKPAGNAYYSSVMPNDLIIKSKKFEPENYILIEEITGAHTANSMTSEFSILVNKARLVSKNGEKPLKPFMINSSMVKLFNNLLGSFGKENMDLNLISKNQVFSGINLIY